MSRKCLPRTNAGVIKRRRRLLFELARDGCQVVSGANEALSILARIKYTNWPAERTNADGDGGETSFFFFSFPMPVMPAV
jgi:hypothetical protein